MWTFQEKTRPPAVHTAKLFRGPLKIREATFRDYSQIAALQVRNGLRSRSFEDWQSIWTGNPVYKRIGDEWPIGWVLETESGAIVGSISNIPLAYHFRGRELRATTSCSWVVDERYRSYSMMLMSCLIKQKGIDLFICTTVSAASEPTYSGPFQFSRVPVGTWNKSEFWITNYRGFSRSTLMMKSVPLADLVSYPVSGALVCWHTVKDAGLRFQAQTPEIKLCSDFDSRFDEFWDELKHQNKDVLLALRTREALAWHFRYARMRQNVWILTACEGSRLVAYAVFDRSDNTASGLKRVRLVDFRALKGSEQALRWALSWMLRQCREDGIHVLENAGCWLDKLVLSQIPSPYQRTLNSWTYYYKAVDRELGAMLANPNVWAPSSFDGDTSL